MTWRNMTRWEITGKYIYSSTAGIFLKNGCSFGMRRSAGGVRWLMLVDLDVVIACRSALVVTLANLPDLHQHTFSLGGDIRDDFLFSWTNYLCWTDLRKLVKVILLIYEWLVSFPLKIILYITTILIRWRATLISTDVVNERASSRRRSACHERKNAAASGFWLCRNSTLLCVVSKEAVGSGEDWIS